MSIVKRNGKYLAQIRKQRTFELRGSAESWVDGAKASILAALSGAPHLIPRRIATTVKRSGDRYSGHVSANLTFSTRRGAERWRITVEDAISDPVAGAGRGRSVGDAIDVYANSPAFLDLQASTREKRTLKLEWWRRRVGELPVAALQSSRLAEERDRLASGETAPGGRPVSANTVCRYLSAISAVLKEVQLDREWIEDNPVRRIRRPSTSDYQRRKVLTDPEVRLLLDAAPEATDRRLLPMVYLSLSSGARPIELAELRVEDVDVAQGTAVIRRSKNGQPRKISWHGPAREVMADYMSVAQISGEVFPGLTKGSHYPRAAWDAVRSAAGIDAAWYSMRGTAGTWLAQLGASEWELMWFFGHSSPAPARHYVQMAAGRKSEIGPLFVRRLMGGAGGGNRTHMASEADGF